MRDTLKRLRTIVLIAALAVAFYGRPVNVRAASAHSPQCGDVCADASCDTECETWVGDNVWFTNCGDYGVCVADPYCGDGICQPENGEDYTTCGDCPEPPPPPPPPAPSQVVLVNGSFTQDPDWIYPGSDMYDAIAATYGTQPYSHLWTQNQGIDVLPPFYDGIFSGGIELANVISALPEGNVQVVTHSHGGNVAIVSTYWTGRHIRHMVNLATPVNWDLFRNLGTNAYSRCEVSSWSDWVQFIGASPYQVYEYIINIIHGIQADWAAIQALIDGDWEAFFYYAAWSAYYYWEADQWFASTKIEWAGPTFTFNGLGHSDMHTPGVWNAIAPYCATNGG